MNSKGKYQRNKLIKRIDKAMSKSIDEIKKDKKLMEAKIKDCIQDFMSKHIQEQLSIDIRIVMNESSKGVKQLVRIDVKSKIEI